MICNQCGASIDFSESLEECPNCHSKIGPDEIASIMSNPKGYSESETTITLTHPTGLTEEIKRRIENQELEELILAYNINWNPQFQYSNSPFFRSKISKINFKISIHPSVKKLNFLFAGCSELEEAPLINTVSIKELQYMFYGCINLRLVPNYNLTNAKNLMGMFEYCPSIEGINTVQAPQATNMSEMFADCANLKHISKIISNSAVDISNMFVNCVSLESVPEMNTTHVTNMKGTFKGCKSLTAIKGLNTANVQDISGCFEDCNQLASINNLNTKNATNVAALFKNCVSLYKAPLFDVDKVTYSNEYADLFTNCPQTNIVYITNNTTVDAALKERVASDATEEVIFACSPNEYVSPFYKTDKKEIKCKISMFSYISDTSMMFADSPNLEKVPLFNTSNVTNLSCMFMNCTSLEKVPEYDLSNANNLEQMFKNCVKLKEKLKSAEGKEADDMYEGIKKFSALGRGIGFISGLFGKK